LALYPQLILERTDASVQRSVSALENPLPSTLARR
jgi:hypothetical protein